MNNKLKIVVRLTRERYLHNNEIVEKTKLRLLKRKSKGSLDDLIFDPDYNINKLDLCKYDEGIYELLPINISKDIESGIVDDWELTLKKINED